MNNVNASQYFVFQKWGSKCQVACGRLGLSAALVLKAEALPISCPLTRLRYCCLVCAYSMNWISICPVLSGASGGGGVWTDGAWISTPGVCTQDIWVSPAVLLSLVRGERWRLTGREGQQALCADCKHLPQYTLYLHLGSRLELAFTQLIKGDLSGVHCV